MIRYCNLKNKVPALITLAAIILLIAAAQPVSAQDTDLLRVYSVSE